MSYQHVGLCLMQVTTEWYTLHAFPHSQGQHPCAALSLVSSTSSLLPVYRVERHIPKLPLGQPDLWLRICFQFKQSDTDAQCAHSANVTHGGGRMCCLNHRVGVHHCMKLTHHTFKDSDADFNYFWAVSSLQCDSISSWNNLAGGFCSRTSHIWLTKTLANLENKHFQSDEPLRHQYNRSQVLRKPLRQLRPIFQYGDMQISFVFRAK